MEALSLVFILGIYVGIRLLLGHHKTPSMRDREKYRKGVHLVYDREYEKALNYFKEVVKKAPKSGVAWAFKAECHLFLGDNYQTLDSASKALNIDYTLRDCYIYRGKAFLALEHYQDALTEFDLAIWHFRGKHPETFRYRGICYYHLNQYKKAEYDLKRAVKLGDEEANYHLLQMQHRLNVKK